MFKILFVCHGNICRSPLAEFVMKQMTSQAKVADNFEIASAATSSEEIGNPVYPPVRELLLKYNVPFTTHRARRMTRDDYEYYDLIVVMDKRNLSNIVRITGADEDEKIHLLLEFAGRPGAEVADPWYCGNFEQTWRDVNAGCRGLLDKLLNK